MKKIENINEELSQKIYDLLKEYNYENNEKRSQEVLKILSKLYTDDETKLSAFFLAFVRDGIIPSEVIGERFSKEVETLINQVIKLDKFDIKNKEAEAEMLRNMLVAIAKDIRVIMIKLSDVLYTARNLSLLEKEKQEDLHKQIGDIYAPLSARLGFNFIKSELQNLNLKFTKPKEYLGLEKQLEVYKEKREKQIEIACDKLRELCNSLNIKTEVYGRVKNISSIYNKLQEKGCNLNQIYDLTAIRVICNDVNECYAILTAVYSIYKPIDGRFKDYIARPKTNGYESLHTTVISESGEPLEIQIRTRQMHDFAEYGVAAHWLYKEKKSKRNLVEEKLTSIRKLIENPENTTLEELLESLKTDVYSGEIFVQTPKGKIISLVEGSTPIDFAYAIHGNIGNKCVGAKINGKMMPLSTKLNNGDEVEIITNQLAKGPSRDWLKIIKTSQARKQINQFFKREMKEDNIKKGKSIIEAFAKTKEIPLHKITTEKYLKVVFDKYSLKDIDEIYAAVGYGSLTANQIINKLYTAYKQDNIELETKKTKTKVNEELKSDGVLIKGADGVLCRFANCCHPIPNDAIIGFVSRSKGVTIHRMDCPNVFNLSRDRMVEVSWGKDNNKSFVARIVVECKNHEGILMQITKKLFDLKVNINSVKTSMKSLIETIINLEITIMNPDILDKVLNEIRSIPDIYDVYRK